MVRGDAIESTLESIQGLTDEKFLEAADHLIERLGDLVDVAVNLCQLLLSGLAVRSNVDGRAAPVGRIRLLVSAAGGSVVGAANSNDESWRGRHREWPKSHIVQAGRTVRLRSSHWMVGGHTNIDDAVNRPVFVLDGRRPSSHLTSGGGGSKHAADI